MGEKPVVFHYEDRDPQHPDEGNLRHRSLERHRTEDRPPLNANNTTFHDPPSRRLSQHGPNNLSTSPAPRRSRHPSPDTSHHRFKDTSFTISPEMFEKLYLNPPTNKNNDLTARYGNPTPIALLGFLLTASPLSCELMGWMGAGGGGAATNGAYYFIGGFFMSLGGILEFFLGNTFSFVVFVSFGGFWFTLGATLTPAFNAYGAYSPDPANPLLGLQSAGFHASFGFFLLFMGLLSLMYTICALRTNMIFVTSFTALTMLFAILTGSYWNAAIGSMELAKQQQFVAGGFGLVSVSGGWYMFLAQMLASVDFPLQLPVGDLSHMIKPLSARVQEKEMFSA